MLAKAGAQKPGFSVEITAGLNLSALVP